MQASGHGVVIFIDIHGQVPQKRRLCEYANNIMEYLIPNHMGETSIDVYVKKQLSYEAAGYCHGDDYSVIIELARNSCGEPYTLEEMAVTLGHELVHAKQNIGEYSGIPDHEKREREAYYLEQKLFEKFW